MCTLYYVLNLNQNLLNLLILRAVCLFLFQFRNFKIVYRRYAGLYFCFCVDVHDNNLYYLEAIHNFVEVRTRNIFIVLKMFIFLRHHC